MRKKRLPNNSANFNYIDYIRKKVISPKKHKLLIYTIVLFILAIIYVWERVEIDAVSLNINRLKEEKSSLIALNEILKAENENKTRFESIEKIAKDNIGMEFPGNNSVVLVIDNPDKKTIFKKVKELFKKLAKTF
ncbi:MAG: hypothetical protein HWN67_10950 [Candidatus Helarchaeota archaeon]|nr:hypothetical protein [Candidatus Helarchaeota archaeon]